MRRSSRFNAAIYGWYFEQLTAEAGKTYCNNDNGRTTRADAVTFDDPEQVQVLSWWKGMVADGLATNTGRNTDDAQAAFKSGTIGMGFESTGVLGGYVKPRPAQVRGRHRTVPEGAELRTPAAR